MFSGIDEVVDTINFSTDPVIKAILNKERICFAGQIVKKHYGFFTREQTRNFVITDESIYNFKGKEIKRKIDIDKIKCITISKTSNDFLIHGNNQEYDYTFVAKDQAERLKIIQILSILYSSKMNKDILFTIMPEKDLKKYVVSEEERKKNPYLFKIKTEELMSVQEFIESDGNLNINKHANSYLLEGTFLKSVNKFHEEQLSNFEIINLIGTGNTANIYLAKYQGKNVVLKVFDKVHLLKNNLIEHVLLEKNILTYFDYKFLSTLNFFFMTNTKIIFVLPFYQGGDLFNFLQKNGNFTEDETAFYAVQIANMIRFLHEKKIVFRDLKLENICIGSDGYLKLIDFGSCKVIEDDFEKEGSFEGSIDYLSPEIIRGEGHRFQTDWWSFGVCIYELIYGEPPFGSKYVERIMDLIMFSKVRHPTSRVKVDSVTIDFINQLLNKDEKSRLGSNGGYAQVIAHNFFSKITPEVITEMSREPPKKPEISEEDLTANFDKYYLNMEIEDFDNLVDKNIINQNLEKFEEFKE